LVYVPPLGSNYCMDAGELDIGEDVYRHREAYFSVGTGGGMDHSVPRVGVTPSSPSREQRVLYQTPLVASPGDVDGAEEDAYDYFEGPDMGVAFSDKRIQLQRMGGRDNSAVSVGEPDRVRYVEGRAASDIVGRSSGTPQVVVKVVDPAINSREKSRSRSRSGSRSRTPSPADFTAPSSTPSISSASSAVAVR